MEPILPNIEGTWTVEWDHVQQWQARGRCRALAYARAARFMAEPDTYEVRVELTAPQVGYLAHGWGPQHEEQAPVSGQHRVVGMANDLRSSVGRFNRPPDS